MTKQDQAVQAQAELTDDPPHDLTIKEAFDSVGGWMNGGDTGYPSFGSFDALQVYTVKMIRSYLANKKWQEQGLRSAAREQARNEAQWISVEERLPDLGQEVLIWCGYRICGYRSDDKNDPENHDGWVIDFDNGRARAITHWMPLPEAPAASKEGDNRE